METEPQLYHLPGFYEPFSAMSHLVGAAVFLFLGALLVRRGRRNPTGMIYLTVYAASVVLLMTLSGMYHMAVRGSPAHQLIGRLDHSAIFILIAGSFTPAHGILFRGFLRWGPLSLIWSAAIAGITLKILFYNEVPEWVILAFYLSMGWFGIVTGLLLAWRYGIQFVALLLIGGLAYTVGAIIDFHQRVIFIPGVIHPHEFLHMTVLIGAFSHWLFNWQFARGEKAVASLLRRSGKTVQSPADLAYNEIKPTREVT
jgi:hemolysin III